MNDAKRTFISFRILIASVVLGVIGDSFLDVRPWGAGVAAFAAVVFGVCLYVRRVGGATIAKSTTWVAFASVAFAALFAWRDADGLRALNGLVLFICVGFTGLRAGLGAVYAARLSDLMWRAPLQWFGFIGHAGRLVAEEIRWKEMTEKRRLASVFAVGRGLLLAVVPVGLVIVLLANADAVFEKVMTPNISIDPGDAFLHFCVWIIVAFLCAGFLRKMFIARGELNAPPVIAPPQKTPFKFGITEIVTVLISLNAVVGLFVGIQFRYLFGGAGHVQSTTGLSYAEYARHGFFELLTVVALAIPMLMAMNGLLKRDNLRHQKIFRCVSGIFVVQIFVVAASALERMKLYVDFYSLSPLRLYAVTGMIFMIGLLGLFLGTTLRGKSNRFAFGAFVWLAVVVFGLNIANPDAMIARYNLQPRPGYTIDTELLASLSSDATPVLLSGASGLDSAAKREVNDALRAKYDRQALWQSQTLSYRAGLQQWEALSVKR